MSARYVPQVGPLRRPFVFWFVGAVLALIFFGLILLAPLAVANGHPAVAEVLYRAFGALCHQIPERSYFIDEHKLGVCSRCTGLYGGFALTMLLYPLVRSLRNTGFPARKWLLLAALPLAIDYSLTFLGLWENTHTSRLLTGILLGSVTVFYVMPGVIDLSLRGRGSSQQETPRLTFTLASPESIASAPSDYSAPERRI